MKRFSTYFRPIFPLAAALALPLAQGCSDDILPDGEGGGDAERGVVVYVPKVEPGVQLTGSGRTRGALNDYKANEGDINSLQLFAYPVNEGDVKVFDLKGDDVKRSLSAPENYEGYVLDLTPGDYRLYVVANVDFRDPAPLSEANLKSYEVEAPESAEKGLPMSCANSGMMVSYNGDDSYKSVGEQGITVAGGATVKVKADLKFAVAKVRVTMLNDLRPGVTLDNAMLDNLGGMSLLMPGTVAGEPGATSMSGPFTEYSYYTLPEMRPDLLKVDVDNMEPTEEPAAEGWAWQGTSYVGERLFSKSDEPSTVTLTFSDSTNKGFIIGTKGEGVKRSYFYDYVGNSKGEFKLEVQPWDPVTIAGALHGPYFLHVDRTGIDIEAGESASIWYESNAPIECISGTYTPVGGEPIDIYQFSVTDNSISVSVNPKIKAGELEKVKEEDGWKHFTVKAGTILKQIDVNNLDLHEFLTVDVNSVTIDVREQIASGIYSGSFVIPIRTNLERFRIERVSWEGVAGSEVVLCDPDGSEIENFDILPGESGVYNLQVRFNGLNDGLAFWQSRRQLQFTVSGTFADGTAVSETVNVNVLASNEDYIIHLYAPGWSSPHIFVYQTLKLPADHKDFPNGAVGDGVGNAALEYSFTGGAAFKGWNVTTDGINYNNPNDDKVYDGINYFYTFSEGSISAGNWVVGQSDWRHHYYDMDFCASYRATVDCDQCKDINNSRLWPGIKMQSEGDGWWVFRLPGIATPGNALIMFTDATTKHDANGTNRYPGSNEPGVPLFDYPSREGYFSVGSGSTHQFSPTRPDIKTPTPSENYVTYRIQWHYEYSGVKRGYIYIENLPEGSMINGTVTTGNSNFEPNGQSPSDPNIKYFDFQVPVDSRNFTGVSFFIKKGETDYSEQWGFKGKSSSDFNNTVDNIQTFIASK